VGISYDPGANRIIVTGYSEDSPCTFEDIYQADKAGELVLVDRNGVSGIDSDPVNNSCSLRPADEKVMGGAKHDLWIEIENFSGFTDATIRLIGKDVAGNDQTEDIVVTGNGTYYSDELWTELTQTQVVGVNGSGSFDYRVTQGQWGVVSKQGDNQFRIEARLDIGDGSTATYFADDQKVIDIHYDRGLDPSIWYINANAVATFGKLQDEVEKRTSSGCVFLFTIPNRNFAWRGSGTLYLYSCMVFSTGNYDFRLERPTKRIYNCIFTRKVFMYQISPDIFRLTVSGSPMPFSDVAATLNDARIEGAYVAIEGWYATLKDKKFKNVKVIANAYACRFWYFSSSYNFYLIDADIENWKFDWRSSSGKVWRQYTFNLEVVDTKGNPIPGASVKIWDKNNNLVVNETTDTNGKIPEQILNYGYYDEAHGNIPVMHTPHVLQISKPGFRTYKLRFTAGCPITWTIKLSHLSVCVDQEVMMV